MMAALTGEKKKQIAEDHVSSQSYFAANPEKQDIKSSPRGRIFMKQSDGSDVYELPPCNIVESSEKESLEYFLTEIGLNVDPVSRPVFFNSKANKYYLRLPDSCKIQLLPEVEKLEKKVNVSIYSLPQMFFKTSECMIPTDVIEPWELNLPLPPHAAQKNPPANLADFEPVKFDWTKPDELKKMKKHFDEEGYCVVKGVASNDDLALIREMFWSYVEGVAKSASGITCRRNDLTTWQNDMWLCPRESGVASQFSVGQADFMHYARSLEGISKAFSVIWNGDEELVSSFDGCGIFRPPSLNTSWVQPDFRWLHVDQGAKKLGFHCAQGQLVVAGNDEVNGVFIVSPRSHLLHTEYMRINAEQVKGLGDFVMIDKASTLFPEAVKLITTPGDFIIWDSRTVHANVPPSLLSKGSTCSKKDLNLTDLVKQQRTGPYDICRLVLYICMMPAKMCNSPEIVQQRQQLIAEGFTTTHWPAECRKSGYARSDYKVSKYLSPVSESDTAAEKAAKTRLRKLCSLDPY